MKSIFALMAAVALLSACGDKPQALDGTRSEDAAFKGTGKAYVVPGWKAGDKTSWESQLKTRGQNGQNEYNRSN